MSTAEIDFQMNFEQDQQAEADKRLLVVFYRKPVQLYNRSEIEGRPIFEDRDFIKILSPGSRDTFEHPATPYYQARFPRQWDAYKRNISQDVEGTLLSQVNWLAPSQVAELNALNLRTVEQLAAMPDAVAHRLMNAHALRQQASAYLSKSSAAEKQQQIDTLTSELQTLREQFAALVAAQQPREPALPPPPQAKA
jgi:hypothetical protein